MDPTIVYHHGNEAIRNVLMDPENISVVSKCVCFKTWRSYWEEPLSTRSGFDKITYTCAIINGDINKNVVRYM